MTPAIVFDLDSTLADTRHRQWMIKPKGERTDWEAYSLACVDDTPITSTRRLLQHFADLCFHDIVIITGRSSAAYDATVKWLADHGFPHDRLIMRPEGDRTPNPVFKTSVVSKLIGEGYEIELFVDDYEAVAEAMHEKHPDIEVLIVNPGYHGAEGA